MRLSRTSWILICVFSVSMVGLLNPGVTFGYDLANVQLQVSPNVLNLGSKGEIVTVHTDLPYSIVKGATVLLNGIPISWWKSDDRGFFVAKFDMEKVKYEVGVSLTIGVNTVILAGETMNNEPFIGKQTLKIIDK